MNSPTALHSLHSGLSHTAILTNPGCLPRPVSWERDQEGAPHSHFMLEPVYTETVKVSSSSVLYPLVRPLFQDVLGIFPGRFRGTRVTFNDYQLTPESFLTHGAGGCWDNQV